MAALFLAAALCAQAAPPPDLYALEHGNAWNTGQRLHRYLWNGSDYSRGLVWPSLSLPWDWRLIGGFLDLDNETVAVVASFTTTPQLVGLSPSGVVRWLTPLPWMCVPALDQSGDLVAVRPREGFNTSLLRLNRAGAIVATIATYGPLSLGVTPEWVTVDLDSGDYLVQNGAPSGPGIVRVTPAGQVSTVAGLETVEFGIDGSLEPDYRTGAWLGVGLAGGSWQTRGWKRMQLQPAYVENRLYNLMQSPFVGGTTLFQSTRLFGVLPYVPNGWPAGVAELPATGGPSMPLYRLNPPPVSFYGIAGSPIVAGHRKLAGVGPATPGSEYSLLLSFPGEAGSAYVVGASLGLRPGLSLPGGAYVPLNPDPLLVWSLSDPQTFAGFSGTLDPTGRALARWRIPALPGLRGLRAFFCAVTIGPGLRTVSDPIGVTVR